MSKDVGIDETYIGIDETYIEVLGVTLLLDGGVTLLNK